MKVIIAGDFASRARTNVLLEDQRFNEIFSDDLRNIIRSADFSFVNLETPVIADNLEPIAKYGPSLKCTPQGIQAIKYAGFTGVTMANNHILDYGIEGLAETIKSCRSEQLDIVGVGGNLKEAESILYLAKDDVRLAIINCCEHEFSAATLNSPGANPLNPVRQYYSIQQAREIADYVLVIVHGGHEYCQLPSLRMQELYRYFIDAGADAVVNHHQHCFSGYEEYKSKFIFYGLGNFCFDREINNETSNWNKGYMVEINFGPTLQYKLYPYEQCSATPSVNLLSEDTYNEDLQLLNTIISTENLLIESMEAYYASNIKHELSILEPYTSRVMRKLNDLDLLPSFLNDSKIKAILNHIECESHRDKMIYALKHK